MILILLVRVVKEKLKTWASDAERTIEAIAVRVKKNTTANGTKRTARVY